MKSFWSGLKTGFHSFGELILNFVNFLLLLIIYILGVGLTSALAKIFKKRFLEPETYTEKESHWISLNISKRNVEKYYDQF